MRWASRWVYSGLMTEALSRAPEAAASATPGSEPMVHYKIVRSTNGKSSESDAAEDTAVLPGDVVKVEVTAPRVNSN